MTIIIDNAVRIPLEVIDQEQLEAIQARLTFPNPVHAEVMARLRSQGRATSVPYDAKGRSIPEFIRGWRLDRGILFVPRGCASEVIEVLGIDPGAVVNRTRHLPEVDFQFKGRLKPVQEPACNAILQRRFGALEAPTGSGKTVMGLYAIAQRRQPALVVVHTTKLLHQWVERAIEFLDMAEAEIGIVGQGQKRIGKRLTIALVQTLHKCPGEITPHIGHLIVDECHHLPAFTAAKAASRFDSAYMLGLSATHKRADGLDPLIYWHIGPLVYRVARKDLLEAGVIVDVEPVFRETGWQPPGTIMRALEDRTAMAAAGYRGERIIMTREERRNANTAHAALVTALSQSDERNLMIIRDIHNEVTNGPCIVLTDRVEHAEVLARLLKQLMVQAEACHGGIQKNEQTRLTRDLNEGRLRVLVGTGQLLGEGFDCKQLTALFLATPVKFSGRLIQFLGRVARAAEGKTRARVYDYMDESVPALMKMARERMRTYRKLAGQSQGPTRRKK